MELKEKVRADQQIQNQPEHQAKVKDEGEPKGKQRTSKVKENDDDE
jgi:hypothetical protein